MASRPARVRVAGIDVGTSYLKAVCVDLDPTSEDPVELVALRRAPTPATADELVATALGLLRETAAGGSVSAIGIASMAETGVPLDARGAPLTPLLTWDAVRPLSPALGALDGADLFVRTGVRLSPKTALATWAWLAAEHPGVRARMRHWAGAADLVALALTGRLATDHTLAGRTGALDLDAGRWAEDLLDLVGMRPELLPEVAVPGEPVGHADAIPVAVAGHDHQVGAHACGVRAPGETADSVGTSEVVLRVLAGRPDPLAVRAAGMSLVRTVGGRALALQAGSSSSGAAYAAWEAQHGPVAAPADLPPGPSGLLVLPYLRGRQCPDPDPGARMRVVGDLAAASEAERGLALLEGLSLQTRWMYDVERGLDPRPGPARPLVLFGGPGARNESWTRVRSRVLPPGLRVVDAEEPVAVGAAIVGAERAGLVEAGSVVLPAGPVLGGGDETYAATYEAFVREARRG
ncbi:FGGY-family carbohydrate kinase [Nocardioides sp.]|uniref:FGGY-family carbohydrate kinase n=1 Tax=Nocardioides sp. TaxID=35761 RepID=UPI002ED9C56D